MEAAASFRTVSRPSAIPFLTRARGDLPEALLDMLSVTGETDSRSVVDL